MKAGDLTDETIQFNDASIVVEMPNGDRVTVRASYNDLNGKGDPIIVLVAGRKLKTN